MSKTRKRSGRVETGMVSFGSMGVSGESNVYNSRGRAVSGNPTGQRARMMIGDSGITAHEREVTDAARSLSRAFPGTRSVVETKASRSTRRKK